MVTQEQPSIDTKERALVAVCNWRAADKVAFINKSDRDAQRAEYKERNNLRAAADDLKATP